MARPDTGTERVMGPSRAFRGLSWLAEAVDFDAAADELYAANREDFVARRGELARQAAQDGDRTLSNRVKALRKPTVAAWLVNRVVRDEPGRAAKLAELGASLRTAHEQLAGDRVRELSERRRALQTALVDRAREAGGDPSRTVLDEVASTFDAVAADEEVGGEVLAGRLTVAVTSDGGWPLPDTAAASTPAAGRASRPRRGKPKEERSPAAQAAEQAVESAREALARAEREDQVAHDETERLRAAWESARSRAAETGERLADAREDLAAAQREARRRTGG
ncbi:hypothetical protein GIY23_14275 [Allosaccharopolyspora coralli]|uniref:Uncharacterized protein n=1 Tax=Allosaccharopolyspora coralli TaxID=2665642 RepID=A0A5Q3Q7R8_9PSEU|nr:hypothetical protein [Allosaccharopolyspora coralli]QGK70532.1 hypothetical protein GIY23_14275 [Allosaccharopolyspora coralli]